MVTVAVSPNRMELLRMKKKQQFAQRGHKLLKDKLEGLLKDFTRIVQEYAVLRAHVDSELGELFQQFILASASMPAEVYRSALAFPECEAELTMTENLIMNVRVPVFSFAIEGNLLSYGTDGTVVQFVPPERRRLVARHSRSGQPKTFAVVNWSVVCSVLQS